MEIIFAQKQEHYFMQIWSSILFIHLSPGFQNYEDRHFCENPRSGLIMCGVFFMRNRGGGPLKWHCDVVQPSTALELYTNSR